VNAGFPESLWISVFVIREVLGPRNEVPYRICQCSPHSLASTRAEDRFSQTCTHVHEEHEISHEHEIPNADNSSRYLVKFQPNIGIYGYNKRTGFRLFTIAMQHQLDLRLACSAKEVFIQVLVLVVCCFFLQTSFQRYYLDDVSNKSGQQNIRNPTSSPTRHSLGTASNRSTLFTLDTKRRLAGRQTRHRSFKGV
jgi:hypothetical protein